ncbi:MAG: hypothetical protein ACXVBL_00590 [Bdellovibrionota bacterium]
MLSLIATNVEQIIPLEPETICHDEFSLRRMAFGAPITCSRFSGMTILPPFIVI